MENKNMGLKVLVVILCVLVLGLGGYFFYDKVFNEDIIEGNSTTNNGSNGSEGNELDNKESLNYNKLVETLNENFNVAYDYYNLVTPYCGDSKYIGEVEGANHINGSYVSEQFSSYDEMLSYLKKYMSEEVIGKKTGFSALHTNSYVEKDGKLYCEASAKGGGMLSGMYTVSEITLQIDNLSDNKINASALIALILNDGQKFYDYNNINVIFEKQNDNWIITSFEIVKGAY